MLSMLSMLVLSSAYCVASTQVVDDSSLLQSFVHKQQPPPPETDALLHSVQRVANSFKRGAAAKMTPDQVEAALLPVRFALTMLPTFQEEHDRAQKQVDVRFREIKRCHEDDEFGEAVMARHAKKVTNELAARDQCNEAQALALEKETRECGRWNDHAAELYNSLPDRSRASTPEELFEVYSTWKHWVEEKGAQIELQRQGCKKATTATPRHAELCAAKTDAYNEWFCMHSLSCAALAQCQKHKIEAYNTLLADEEAALAPQQQQYQSMMRAQCLMQLINSASQTGSFIDEESMTSCHDVKVADLSVTRPGPIPAIVECPAPQNSGPACDDNRALALGKIDASDLQPAVQNPSGLSTAPGFTGTSVKFHPYVPVSNDKRGLLAQAAELFRFPA